MENNPEIKQNTDKTKQKRAIQVAMVFFAKASAWIIIPAIVITLVHFFTKGTRAGTYAVLISAIVAVSISFYGIYKEAVGLINRNDI